MSNFNQALRMMGVASADINEAVNNARNLTKGVQFGASLTAKFAEILANKVKNPKAKMVFTLAQLAATKVDEGSSVLLKTKK